MNRFPTINTCCLLSHGPFRILIDVLPSVRVYFILWMCDWNVVLPSRRRWIYPSVFIFISEADQMLLPSLLPPIGSGAEGNDTRERPCGPYWPLEVILESASRHDAMLVPCLGLIVSNSRRFHQLEPGRDHGGAFRYPHREWRVGGRDGAFSVADAAHTTIFLLVKI